MNSAPETEHDPIKPFIEQLYESEGLTDALIDADARILLEWGEQQLASLAHTKAEQTDLDDAFQQVRRVIRSINRLVERKADLSDTQMVQRLLRLVEDSMKLAMQKSITDHQEESQ